MLTEEDPSDDLPAICLTPSKSCTASSIRIEILFSTSSGVAPRSDTFTLMRSVAKDGNTSSGIRLVKLNKPAIKMVINSKFAAT